MTTSPRWGEGGLAFSPHEMILQFARSALINVSHNFVLMHKSLGLEKDGCGRSFDFADTVQQTRLLQEICFVAGWGSSLPHNPPLLLLENPCRPHTRTDAFRPIPSHIRTKHHFYFSKHTLAREKYRLVWRPPTPPSVRTQYSVTRHWEKSSPEGSQSEFAFPALGLARKTKKNRT